MIFFENIFWHFYLSRQPTLKIFYYFFKYDKNMTLICLNPLFSLGVFFFTFNLISKRFITEKYKYPALKITQTYYACVIELRYNGNIQI